MHRDCLKEVFRFKNMCERDKFPTNHSAARGNYSGEYLQSLRGIDAGCAHEYHVKTGLGTSSFKKPTLTANENDAALEHASRLANEALAEKRLKTETPK